MENVIKEIKVWLDSEDMSDEEKVKSIGGLTFVEFSDEEKIELFEESGDDFEFYIKAIKSINYDFYDGDCIRDMCETILDEFIKMRTFPSDKMKKQMNFILNIKEPS